MKTKRRNVCCWRHGAAALCGVMMVAAVLRADAAEVTRVFALPLSGRADTEAAVSAEPPLWQSAQSEFRLTLTFEASPSNNVEAAFWDDAQSEGEEAATTFGWDCGEVFVDDGVARGIADVAFAPEAAPLTLSVVARLSPRGDPLSTTICANGEPVEFVDEAGAPVAFVHSPEWSSVRIVARGAGETSGTVVVGFAADASVIVTR